jgi:hypothetical protein
MGIHRTVELAGILLLDGEQDLYHELALDHLIGIALDRRVALGTAPARRGRAPSSPRARSLRPALRDRCARPSSRSGEAHAGWRPCLENAD